jgi:DHA1 family inner membrane transport protein
MQTRHAPIQQASWATILILVGAGLVSAIQVGKATVALSTVQGDLHLDLSVASWLLSAFALVGALTGGPIGLAVDRIGARRLLVSGLIVQALSSAGGAFATGAGLLLTMRTIEGLGFLCAVVAAPALIIRIASGQQRQRALSVWATFMPLGITVSLLAAPLLSAAGWRAFWVINAALLAAYAGLVAFTVPAIETGGPARSIVRDIRDTLASAGPWLLAAIFAIFNAAYFAVFGFLPIVLTDRLGVSADVASALTALAVMASAGGNLACGVLLTRGTRPWLVLLTGFVSIGFLALGIFLGAVPGLVSYGLSVAFAFIAGFIPVAILNAVPRHAPRSELVGATMGFTMQGNNVGMTIGPAATGAIAEAFGWGSVSILVAGLSLFAMVLAMAFRARENDTAAPLVARGLGLAEAGKES